MVPEQDTAPCAAALGRLADHGHHRRISDASRAAALNKISAIGLDPVENLLREVSMGGPDHVLAAECPTPPAPLSADRLELLAGLLKNGVGSSTHER